MKVAHIRIAQSKIWSKKQFGNQKGANDITQPRLPNMWLNAGKHNTVMFAPANCPTLAVGGAQNATSHCP